MGPWIVVFGAAVRADGSPSGTLERRVRAAYEFGRNAPDAKYLVTGGQGDAPLPEWQVMQRLLVGYGAALDAIVPERQGRDTLGQIRICAAMLRREDISEGVWISTSRYHQLRCRLLLQLFGIKPHTVAPLADRPHVARCKLLLFWARELIATPYDVALALIGKITQIA